jgi:hypothetical protein
MTLRSNFMVAPHGVAHRKMSGAKNISQMLLAGITVFELEDASNITLAILKVKIFL